MDQESEKRLAEIVAKEPAALSDADLAFLRARQSYLSKDDAQKFASVLKEEPTVKPYSKMNLDELKAAAAEKGIAVDEADKKSDLVAKLEAAAAQ